MHAHAAECDSWVVDRNYHKSWNMTSWWRVRTTNGTAGGWPTGNANWRWTTFVLFASFVQSTSSEGIRPEHSVAVVLLETPDNAPTRPLKIHCTPTSPFISSLTSSRYWIEPCAGLWALYFPKFRMPLVAFTVGSDSGSETQNFNFDESCVRKILLRYTTVHDYSWGDPEVVANAWNRLRIKELFNLIFAIIRIELVHKLARFCWECEKFCFFFQMFNTNSCRTYPPPLFTTCS